MIEFDGARAQILTLAHLTPIEVCPAGESLGRVLAAPVISAENLPPFDNSAMDGFALFSGGVALDGGREFAVRGALMAGDGQSEALRDGTHAFEIMTGARLPDGADAVVPVEQVAVLERDAAGHATRIRLEATIETGRHLRRAGEDVAQGIEVMAAGSVIGPAHLAMLAALGVGQVSVRRRPRVALVCTGRELVDTADATLDGSQIRNSNGPLLAARLREAGAELVLQATVSDEPEAFAAALAQARACGAEVFISTGAVSMGRHDFVPDTLRQAGAQLHFHKVRMRPGKPLLLASLPDGIVCFGLPGNPASSAVGLRFFVEPLLRAMLGMATERPLRVVLEACATPASGWRYLYKGALVLDASGHMRARMLAGQESFRIRPLLQANAWLELAADRAPVQAGDLIDVWPPGHLAGMKIEVQT
ncbi:MAG TPA: gephyrin-like molybdotransferase Glp [Chiayiivirga sp.]|nr:gephyrin-like molybdotransferase Glp [Chiayiivirga sp.]